MSVTEPPSAFVHAAKRLVPGGVCPFCGTRLDGIDATGPGSHRAAPCGCRLSDD